MVQNNVEVDSNTVNDETCNVCDKVCNDEEKIMNKTIFGGNIARGRKKCNK